MATLKISTDFSIICRTCLSHNRLLSDLNEGNINETLTQFTNLKIYSQDRMPKKICSICLNTLQNMLNFVEKCKMSDLILRLVLKEMDLNEKSNKDALSTVESVQSCHENFLEVVEVESSDGETHQEYEKTDIEHSGVQFNGKHFNKTCHKCECCGETFDDQNRLWEHLKQNKTCMDNRFKCPTCSKSFSEEVGLKAHMECHAKKACFKCNICSKAFKSKHYLSRHQTIHEEEETTEDIEQSETQVNEKCLCRKSPRCNHCGEKFSDLKELKKHYNQNEICLKNRFKCPLCSKGFSQRHMLRTHIFSHRKGPFRCNICSKLFRFSHNLLKHQNIHKEEETERMAENEIHVNGKCPFRKSPECTFCGEKFCGTKELMEHFKQNENCFKNRFKCSICSKGFCRRYKLDNHMRCHTKEPTFKCEICSKVFTHSFSLHRHSKIHEGIKRCVCRICGKGFYGDAARAAHLRTHTGGVAFTCKYCGQNFKTYYSHRRHIIRHEAPERLMRKVSRAEGLEQRVPEFLCHLCGKQCMSKVSLDVHIRVHSGIKPYKCSYCSRLFAYQSSLASHTMLHTGRRPYRCNVCDKSFIQGHHLKNHMRTHSGEKPYVCSFCNKGFAVSYNHKVHVGTHTGETPFVCSICNLGFYDSSSLKKHKKGHGEGAELKEANQRFEKKSNIFLDH